MVNKIFSKFEDEMRRLKVNARARKNSKKNQIKDTKFTIYAGRRVRRAKINNDFAVATVRYLFGDSQLIDWKDALVAWERPKHLSQKEIRPLLVVRCAREMEGVRDCYDAMDFIDVLWVKYFPMDEALELTKKFVAKHPEYTHIILTSDDVYPSVFNLQLLINDLLVWDFPILSGCCNFCNVYSKGNMKCEMCEKGLHHPNINITQEPVVYERNGKKVPVADKLGSYNWLTDDWRQSHQHIEKVWFQGLALGVFRRDIFESCACKPYLTHDGTWSYSDDFAVAVECDKAKIPQFCDFRAFMRHVSTHHTKLLVGKREPELELVTAKRTLSDVIPNVRLVPLLITSPFNNESHAIPQYFESLINLDYPKELIDLVWLENDSNDESWELLQKYAQIIRQNYKYHSFKVIRRNYGLKELGKVKPEDFGKPEHNVYSGKNYAGTIDLAIKRAERLCQIYDYFFSLLDEHYHRFWVMFMADAPAPPNTLKRYLEVMHDYPDCGWVGAVHHKRFPTHIRKSMNEPPSIAGLAAPIALERNDGYRYMTDAEILKLQKEGHVVFECGMTGHVFMVRTDIIFSGARMDISNYEIIEPFLRKMRRMGYKMYCASDIYLQHISLDGKIYRHDLYEEVLMHDAEERLLRMKEPNVLIADIVEKQKLDSVGDDSDIMFELYIKFRDYWKSEGKAIPIRPALKNGTVMDNIKNEIITQAEWDERYGKWRVFMDKGHK